IVKGGNYGWPNAEGNCTSACPYTNPIYAYNHDGGSRAIAMGSSYRSSMFPSSYQGRLFFGDYAAGFIKTLTFASNGTVSSVNDFDLVAGSVVDLKTAADGSLYYVTFIPGRLYRVSYSTGNQIPVATAGSDTNKGLNPL